jgi:hypothetical protein
LHRCRFAPPLWTADAAAFGATRCHVVAIPGTTNIAHLEENVAAGGVTPAEDLCGRLDALINHRSISGERYNAATQAEIDTEDFEPEVHSQRDAGHRAGI